MKRKINSVNYIIWTKKISMNTWLRWHVIQNLLHEAALNTWSTDFATTNGCWG